MSVNDDAHVRVTNAQIFEELRHTRSEVASVKQSVEETIKPNLSEVRADVRNLKESKADKAELVALEGTVSSVRVQAWAIGTGVLSGMVILRTLGIF